MLGDFGRNSEGTFLQVLTCMSLAVTSVELIAALLLHSLPAHGRNLATQLGLSEAAIRNTLRVALGAPAKGCPASEGSSSVGPQGLLALALRRCGHSVGEPAPLFRHVGKRLGRAMLRFAGRQGGSGAGAPGVRRSGPNDGHRQHAVAVAHANTCAVRRGTRQDLARSQKGSVAVVTPRR